MIFYIMQNKIPHMNLEVFLSQIDFWSFIPDQVDIEKIDYVYQGLINCFVRVIDPKVKLDFHGKHNVVSMATR